MTCVAIEDVLTPSQQTCLRLVAKQLTSKEIARELGLSPHTIDAHIKAAMHRLGVTSRGVAAQLFEEEEERRFSMHSSFAIGKKGEREVGPDWTHRILADVDYSRPATPAAPPVVNRACESTAEADWRIARPGREAPSPCPEAGKGSGIDAWQWGVLVLGTGLLAANLFVAAIFAMLL